MACPTVCLTSPKWQQRLDPKTNYDQNWSKRVIIWIKTLTSHEFEICWVKDLQITSKYALTFENPPRKTSLSAGRSPWSDLRLPSDAIGFQKQTIHNYPKKIIHVFGNFANENFESPRCFDLMPVLARNTSTYLHVASCVVAFANIFLLFIFKLTICWLWTYNTMAATNPNKTWRVESPWENMRKHNNMSLWSYSTLVRRSLVTRSCDLLWVRHSWKTVVRCDSFVPHFCETLLGLKTLVRHSCEILLQDALLTHCGTTDKQWVKRYI